MKHQSSAAGTAICEAIRSRRKLIFDYSGLRRAVAPYCYGISTRGGEVLRAVQVGGSSSSGGYGFGKLWSVERMSGVQISAESFTADDPDYNPNDSAMTRIICRID